ncbi:MAG TPA: hypothetical protein VMG12_30975 [Polyangiaceae bacterium]|nr:hypothetical protein [Polyangiaceae bacterium]
MDIVVFRPHELPVALGALRCTEPAPSPRQDHYLERLAELHDETLAASALPAPSASETAAVISAPHARERLVQLGVVMSMVDGSISAESIARLGELDRVLGVREPAIATLRKVRARQDQRVQLDVMGRTAGKIVADAYRDTGVVGAFRIVLAFMQLFDDPAMTARFAALEHAPADSLGHCLWRHCTERGLRLPGQRGGIPERGLFHDLGHVLAGYDTDAEGETLQQAFQAGFLRNGGFGHLLLGIIHFHMGIKITPVAAPTTGLFDVDKVLTALARGAACKVDLSVPEQFDFWAHAQQPLEHVRAELGVTPLQEALRTAA